MFKRYIKYFKRLAAMQRITLALARGAATSSLRNIDPLDPGSWEFSAFSQNGEDGIIDYLTGRINHPNRYFIEIGSYDGIENNTAWLAIAKKYSGIMIEGDNKQSAFSKEFMAELNLGVECINLFITKDNTDQLLNNLLHKNPDVFSIDIDGNDYYIADKLMQSGLRPKVIVVEYNSAYGPYNSMTIRYKEDFEFQQATHSQLYFGVSITGWRRFFNYHGYDFITVDRNGVNAFFIDTDEFDANFLDKINGMEFQENYYQLKKLKVKWEKQFDMIKNLPFFEIT